MTQIPDDDLTRRVVACATEVHRGTGPGLTKECYESCLELELTAAGLGFERGRVLPTYYDGHELDFRCRTDFIIEDFLVVQVEAVDEVDFTHEAMLRTCVWMGGFPLGLLLNFNVVTMEEGISRIAARPSQEEPELIVDVFDDPDLGLRP